MTGNIPPERVRAQLEKILASGLFARSERLRRFLRYLVEVSLSGRLELLRELPLGMDVFERGTDFDPRLDPIVRIDARRLRARLTDYYEQAGSGDEIEILLDRGGYVPSFRLRQNEPAEEAPKRQVAVMPFESWSAASSDQHSGRVLTEGIVSALGQVPGWRVRMCFGGAIHRAEPDDTELLVRGGILRQGSSVRVSVNIINVSDGSLVASQRFDRHESQGYELQEDLIRYLVERLGAGDRAGDSEGFHFYLQSRYLMNENTPQTLQRAIGGFQKVVEKDPLASRAWAGMAAALDTSILLGVADPEIAVPQAKHAAEKALEREPDLPEAKSVLAAAMVASGDDPADARHILESVIESHPHCVLARINYALHCLLPNGRSIEARRHVETALTSDPSNLTAMYALSLVACVQGRLEEARLVLEGMVRMSPDYPAGWRQLARVEELAGNEVSSVAAYERYRRLSTGVRESIAVTSSPDWERYGRFTYSAAG